MDVHRPGKSARARSLAQRALPLESVGDEADIYRAAIQRAFPALAVTRIQSLGEGWDSAVWEVNDELVFRFPKRDDVVPWLRREIRLLPELRDALPVPTPRFTYIADGRSGWTRPFVGYPKLEGQAIPISPELPREWEKVAEQVGDFLSAMHAFPLVRAAANDVPRYKPASWYYAHRTLREQIEEWTFPLLASLERRFVSTFLNRLMNLLETADFSPVLVHGDLNEGHVLVDELRSQVAGVIDFGDMRVTDPALDFAQFPLWFAEGMLRTYRGQRDAMFLERARSYGRLEAFRAILMGLDTQNEALVAEGLVSVRHRLRDI